MLSLLRRSSRPPVRPPTLPGREVREADLAAKPLRHTYLPARYHVLDAVGRGTVTRVAGPTGALLRLSGLAPP